MPNSRREFLRDSSLVLSAAAMGAGALGCAEKAPPESPRRDVDLLASYWTIAGDVNPGTGGREWSLFDFRDRVEAIARVGFKGMGLWHADLYHILETRSLPEMKRIFDDNGIVHVEIEFLLDWFIDGELKAASDKERVKLLNAAEALGARHVKVGDFFNREVELDRVAEAFADLCKDAANAGTRILFEVMPFAMIDNLKDSLTMLEAADAPNGGLMIDTWHIVKMRTPYGELATAPRRFLLGVELNDGYVETPEGMDMRTETTEHRKFPGEGDFDMQGFMDALETADYDGPYGVEVISAVNRTLPLEELVRKAYDTTIAQFA